MRPLEFQRLLAEDPDRSRQALRAAGPLDGERPRTWAGARSYNVVWEATDQSQIVEWVTDDEWSPAGRIYATAERPLRDAHVLTIPVAQSRVVPILPFREAVELLTRYRPPFDPLYVDMTDLDGHALTLTMGSANVKKGIRLYLTGFLVYHKEAGAHLVPYVRWHDDERTLDPWHYKAIGEVVVWFNADDPDDPAGVWGGDYMPAVAELEGVKPKNTAACPLFGLGYFYNRVGAGTEPPEGLDVEGQGPDAPGALFPALPAQSFRERPAAGEDAALRRMRDATGIAYSTAATFQTCASVLYFLDAQQVEVASAETRLERRDVKRARKRGWRFADTVIVRHRVSRPSRNGGGHREFAYQFERAGSYHHMTKGSHVRCRTCRGAEAAPDAPECERCHGTGIDPALVTPCRRRDSTGVLTCPHGCRREWHPPAVVGDPDKPLILKTREVR